VRGPSVRAEAPVLLETVAAEAAPAGPASAPAVAAALRAEGADWLGTPYRFGGESRRGINCSAFTRALMREAFGLELPRNTALQVNEGTHVSQGDLRPGDLVFFRRGGTRHVGVYLGDGEFIHASSSRGVTVSRLDEGYYQRHYWTSRRVLGPAGGGEVAEVRRRPRTRAEREAERAARAAEAREAAAPGEPAGAEGGDAPEAAEPPNGDDSGREAPRRGW
jgi:hypothetical protein